MGRGGDGVPVGREAIVRRQVGTARDTIPFRYPKLRDVGLPGITRYVLHSRSAADF